MGEHLLSKLKEQHPQSTSVATVFFLAWDSRSLHNQPVHEAVLTEGQVCYNGDLGEGRKEAGARIQEMEKNQNQEGEGWLVR